MLIVLLIALTRLKKTNYHHKNNSVSVTVEKELPTCLWYSVSLCKQQWINNKEEHKDSERCFKTGLIWLTKVLFEKYYHKVLIAIIWFQSFLLILLKKWTSILCSNNDLKPKLHHGYNLLVLLTVSNHSKRNTSYRQRGVVFRTAEEEWIKQ